MKYVAHSMTLPERIEAHSIPEPNTGCWLWMASTNREGYGSLSYQGRKVSAHRASYEHVHGAIPDGLTIDHLCRQRSCVNPAHLEAVTHRENVLRGESSFAKKARQTHCKYGHEFTDDNTMASGRGRHCRKCNELSSASYYQNNKERWTKYNAGRREYYEANKERWKLYSERAKAKRAAAKEPPCP